MRSSEAYFFLLSRSLIRPVGLFGCRGVGLTAISVIYVRIWGDHAFATFVLVR